MGWQVCVRGPRAVAHADEDTRRTLVDEQHSGRLLFNRALRKIVVLGNVTVAEVDGFPQPPSVNKGSKVRSVPPGGARAHEEVVVGEQAHCVTKNCNVGLAPDERLDLFAQPAGSENVVVLQE